MMMMMMMMTNPLKQRGHLHSADLHLQYLPRRPPKKEILLHIVDWLPYNC